MNDEKTVLEILVGIVDRATMRDEESITLDLDFCDTIVDSLRRIPQLERELENVQ